MLTKETRRPLEQYIPMDEIAFEYRTHDLGNASALLCSGFELLSLDKENPRKALFVFKKENDIEEIANLYFSDRLDVRARSFFDSLKALKNKLYSD